MARLNKEELKEVVAISNHKDIASVEEFILSGDIEVYSNKEEYEENGYDLKYEKLYTILSSGKIVHFIGG